MPVGFSRTPSAPEAHAATRASGDDHQPAPGPHDRIEERDTEEEENGGKRVNNVDGDDIRTCVAGDATLARCAAPLCHQLVSSCSHSLGNWCHKLCACRLEGKIDTVLKSLQRREQEHSDRLQSLRGGSAACKPEWPTESGDRSLRVLMGQLKEQRAHSAADYNHDGSRKNHGFGERPSGDFGVCAAINICQTCR